MSSVVTANEAGGLSARTARGTKEVLCEEAHQAFASRMNDGESASS